ncbi:MAG: Uma2 family endonuclease [Methylocystis sp.]|nr:Uma2 family endonuclease [Methylocystis sp.]
MIALPKTRMSVDEYLAWAEAQPGRYELVDGVVYAQAAERAAHAEMKFAVQKAFDAAIQARRLPCRVMPDGMAVRIDETTAYEPDALVYCGPKLEPDTLLVENPIIVVEVLSPSTGRNDALRKLAGYFRAPSVAHYLIVDPDEPLIIHHARSAGEAIVTRIVREGRIMLDPPGFELALADVYAA